MFNIIEKLKNLRPESVPKTPRSMPEDNISDVTDADDENFNVFNNRGSKKSGPEDISKEKHRTSKPKNDKKVDVDAAACVQVADHMYNINNSKVKIGDTFIFNQTEQRQNNSNKQQQFNDCQTKIKRDHLIDDVMDSKVKLIHEYGDCIAKNMGKNWPNTFRALGYNKGKIDTSSLDWIHYGLAEVRYQLLLDWLRNDEEGTLDKIATVLWNEGEREVVKLLSVIYKKNKEENKYPIATPGPSRATR